MFRRLPEREASVAVEIDGKPVVAAPGDSVAAAMFAAGISTFRRAPVDGGPRGPWCAMGVCFECLVEIDGEPDRQACMTPVREGLRVTRRMEGVRQDP